MYMDREISKYVPVQFVFGQDAVAASQTDVQLPVAVGEASEAVTGYTALFGGWLLGITADLSAAGTAGVFTVGPTIAGTEKTGLQLTMGTTTTQRDFLTRPELIPFSAGDLIGAEITTDGSWDGLTADLAVVVYAIYDLEGI